MKNFKNKELVNIIIHIIAWGLFLSSPLMFSSFTDRQISFAQYVVFVGAPLSQIIVFYLNYFVLVNNLLFKRRVALFILSNILLVALVNLFQSFWMEIFGALLSVAKESGGRYGGPPPMSFIILKDLLMVSFIAALSAAIKVTANLYKTENERRELEKEKSEAELLNLKNQLNPHFLFNTLNNIYSLIAINPAMAQASVHGLSNLLRYVLYDNNDEKILLSKELNFMRSYIDLMSLRIHESVKLNVRIEEPEYTVTIAPLLFMTLTENAFKHGICSTEKSEISIDIHTEINSDSRVSVICEITNSYFPKSDTDRSGSGIGLENLRKRLSLIYPGSHTLTYGVVEEMFVARLVINT